MTSKNTWEICSRRSPISGKIPYLGRDNTHLREFIWPIKYRGCFSYHSVGPNNHSCGGTILWGLQNLITNCFFCSEFWKCCFHGNTANEGFCRMQNEAWKSQKIICWVLQPLQNSYHHGGAPQRWTSALPLRLGSRWTPRRHFLLFDTGGLSTESYNPSNAKVST